MLAALSVSAGRVPTNVQQLQRVWGLEKTGGSGLVRDIVTRLRRKLGTTQAIPSTSSTSLASAIGCRRG